MERKVAERMPKINNFNCTHSAKKDLTQGRGEFKHDYCPTCGAHWFKGTYYSEAEWYEAFIAPDTGGST